MNQTTSSNDPHEKTALIAKVVSYALSDLWEMMRWIMAFPRPAIDAIYFVEI
jgi:hypothetical protein